MRESNGWLISAMPSIGLGDICIYISKTTALFMKI